MLRAGWNPNGELRISVLCIDDDFSQFGTTPSTPIVYYLQYRKAQFQNRNGQFENRSGLLFQISHEK
jgi:hypothetical protein